MKHGLNFKDKNELKRLVEQRTPAHQIASLLGVSQTAIVKFLPEGYQGDNTIERQDAAARAAIHES